MECLGFQQLHNWNKTIFSELNRPIDQSVDYGTSKWPDTLVCLKKKINIHDLDPKFSFPIISLLFFTCFRKRFFRRITILFKCYTLSMWPPLFFVIHSQFLDLSIATQFDLLFTKKTIGKVLNWCNNKIQ